MSILINMGLPEKQTTLTIFPNGYVAIYDAKDSFIGETKAFPVPSHGRLVDLDKIENEIARLSPEGYTTGGIRLILDCAPTIIEAEEGE